MVVYKDVLVIYGLYRLKKKTQKNTNIAFFFKFGMAVTIWIYNREANR